MKKQLLLLLFAFVCLNCFSQISFEKGYFINNSGETINCLIKNVDWYSNPTNFEYKVSENGLVKKADIKSVKEFGINNTSKYLRSRVEIDKSSKNLNAVGYTKAPEFKEELLFLEVLVEGSANLYLYRDSSLKRFFYNKDKETPQQLVYKKYRHSHNQIRENNHYQQQLLNNLKCATITTNKIENIGYYQSDLVSFFTEYNICTHSDFVVYKTKGEKDLFNISIRPRLNSSSLSIKNPEFTSRNSDFDNETSFGIGVELEYVLPFNKNKWSIVAEPTYQYFKAENVKDVSFVVGGKLVTKADYSSIEVPLSVRHYFFLNTDSKIFANVSYVLDFASSSSIELNRADNSTLITLDVNSGNNFAFGIGYKLLDKYSVEVRYLTSRNILNEYRSYTSEYKTLSFIVGYTLF